MIATILSDLWPILLGGIVAIGALLTGWARHKQAQTTEAQAGQKVAEAEKREADKDAALARANEAGAQAGADNAKVRRDEDSAAAGEPDANRVLHDEWGK
ncbi:MULTISPECIES: hypothetical protein [unclassified Cupriavidus]|uniref:hypothetical protein n=1 Tax=unclassified Cupriavidus TaxID=2640874 RepID=UPI001BFFE168|nr:MULTISPECIES: hypothetical protein [unclassified Cupriavidus]MCA3182743.1 hypothetical protein [Cupriavidus sp.]MCA3189805.1 hypothetical protein [Cupriavidus sp.]MCA3196399.1 hypothetical protein [Cupriavidus sp.]MCA3202144.1 hypothetical protein [Cupriavidus sp.]QWE93283.1 hypothetical protein KLP38_09525 [Cupriavidus sp. EM10]